MIVHDDWIWMHFPKCAGTFIEQEIRSNYDKTEAVFDRIDPNGEILWHHTIEQRRKHDPSFDTSGKRIICAIRRLPFWLLSRVHFERSRPPFLTTPRTLFQNGQFYENTGFIHKADDLLRSYTPVSVTDWLRQEELEQDMRKVFGSKFKVSQKRKNATKIDYIKDLEFWFTPSQLSNLYNQNPIWADLEAKLYGSIIEI